MRWPKGGERHAIEGWHGSKVTPSNTSTVCMGAATRQQLAADLEVAFEDSTYERGARRKKTAGKTRGVGIYSFPQFSGRGLHHQALLLKRPHEMAPTKAFTRDVVRVTGHTHTDRQTDGMAPKFWPHCAANFRTHVGLYSR